jgi:hypothetical protein
MGSHVPTKSTARNNTLMLLETSNYPLHDFRLRAATRTDLLTHAVRHPRYADLLREIADRLADDATMVGDAFTDGQLVALRYPGRDGRAVPNGESAVGRS